MKILFVTDALAVYGGLERVLVEKANWLVENANVNATILTTSQCGRSVSYLLDPRISLLDPHIQFHHQYRYRGMRRFMEAVRLHRRFRDYFRDKLADIQPDVIDCVRLDLISDILKVKGTIPLVYESHSSFWASCFEGASFLRKLHTLWLNFKVRQVQAVVSLTNGDAKMWKIVNKSVYVIPNIVHINDRRPYCGCLSKSVTFVGRFSKQKDIESLLTIWEQVHPKFPDWELHIYGERGDAGVAIFHKLEQMSESVVVHKPVADIFKEYKKHSVLLLTSLYEPFGLVSPEAMSCGIPVVSFDCPYGPADIITDGVDGFLIKNRDIHTYVEKVCQLIEDEELRHRMGKNGIVSSQRYRADIIMPQWIRLFDGLTSDQ